VTQRIGFAERRLSELLQLNGGDLNGADELQRQQLVQEFFFHLVGAIEMVAASVNDNRKLNISNDTITTRIVTKRLAPTDPIAPKLSALYAKTRDQPLPSDPYDEKGYVFRLYNYRNQVSHRGRNPWSFNRGGNLPLITLQLDLRGPSRGSSLLSVQNDLTNMLTLIKRKINEILTML
jgi:hypothetical protein